MVELAEMLSTRRQAADIVDYGALGDEEGGLGGKARIVGEPAVIDDQDTRIVMLGPDQHPHSPYRQVLFRQALRRPGKGGAQNRQEKARGSFFSDRHQIPLFFRPERPARILRQRSLHQGPDPAKVH